MTSHCFPPAHRLHHRHEFDAVFRHNNLRVSHPAVTMIALPNGLPFDRLGMVVSKKNLPRALARNSFKRQTREVFRQLEPARSGLDILVLSRPGARGMQRQAVRKILSFSFNKLAAKARGK